MLELASIATAASINQKELDMRVQKMYRHVALKPTDRYHFEMGRILAEKLGYPKTELDHIPIQAIESFAGVGYFFDLADLRPGENVLDLGSGSGMDVFYAAQQVGPQGEVVGLDMTHEQLEKASILKEVGGFSNTWFVEGRIEEIPVINESLDVIMSNGVINLSSNKMKVFMEAARTLKPGGRLVISDIVSTLEMPESITCNVNLWASCIGGAMPVNDYYDYLETAGFTIVKAKDNPYRFISRSAKGAAESYGIRSVSVLAIKN